MPDQTVQVTFSPQGEPGVGTWTFDDVSVSMTAAGKIKLQKKPPSANWSFVTASAAGCTVDAPTGQGSELTIHDPHDNPPYPKTITYTVTVSANGQQYTSPAHRAETSGTTEAVGGPPPMIVNE